MNELRFLEALGGIDDELIREAYIDIEKPVSVRAASSGMNLYVIGSVAAAAVISVGAAAFYNSHRPEKLLSESSVIVSEDHGEMTSAATDNEKTSSLAETSAAPEKTTAEHNEKYEGTTSAVITETSSQQQPAKSTETEHSLPENNIPTQPPAETPTETIPDPANKEHTTAAPPDDHDGLPEQTTSSPGGIPGAVFTQLNVSFDEAKEKFAHPILPCTEDDFTGYKAGIVSQNGDTSSSEAFCLSVIYGFTDGSITLTDRSRLNSINCPSGDTIEYRGRTFYIEDIWGETHIGYYPALEKGIAYQALFSPEHDIYDIMDMMISVEF